MGTSRRWSATRPDRVELAPCCLCDVTVGSCRADGFVHFGRRWAIGITWPGSAFGSTASLLNGVCQATVEDRYVPTGDDCDLAYRGACAGCGWASSSCARRLQRRPRGRLRSRARRLAAGAGRRAHRARRRRRASTPAGSASSPSCTRRSASTLASRPGAAASSARCASRWAPVRTGATASTTSAPVSSTSVPSPFPPPNWSCSDAPVPPLPYRPDRASIVIVKGRASTHGRRGNRYELTWVRYVTDDGDVWDVMRQQRWDTHRPSHRRRAADRPRRHRRSDVRPLRRALPPDRRGRRRAARPRSVAPARCRMSATTPSLAVSAARSEVA